VHHQQYDSKQEQEHQRALQVLANGFLVQNGAPLFRKGKRSIPGRRAHWEPAKSPFIIPTGMYKIKAKFSYFRKQTA
jgi:hypothetical protein